MATRKEIEAYLEQAYKKNGIDPNIGKAIIDIESQWNPNAKNPNSSAKGLMQFTDATAKSYKINPLDPYQSIDASIKYLKNAAKTGVDITDVGKAYLSWQQGAGGAKKLLTANKNAMIEDVIGKKQARLNGMAGMTVAQGIDKWTGEAKKRFALYGGQPTQIAKVEDPAIQEPVQYIQPEQTIFQEDTFQTKEPTIQPETQVSAPIKPTEPLDLGIFEQKPTAKQKQLEKIKKEEILARAFGVSPDMTGEIDPSVDSLLMQLFEES